MIGVLTGLILNYLPAFSWEFATLIAISVCLGVFFALGYLGQRAPEQHRTINRFFERLRTPLPPEQMAYNTPPENLAMLWVVADQYKHRAMRLNGIAEAGITGPAPAFEKYLNWARTLPVTLGNPLYAWSYLEMKRFFGAGTPLNERSAPEVWEQCQPRIQAGALSPRSLLEQCRVEALCTSDDLLDDTTLHQRASEGATRVLPSLRTDTILDASPNWCQQLAKLTDITITDLESYEAALRPLRGGWLRAGRPSIGCRVWIR